MLQSINNVLRDVYSGLVERINRETGLFEETAMWLMPHAEWQRYRRQHVVPRVKESLRRRRLKRTNPKAFVAEQALRHLTGIQSIKVKPSPHKDRT